MMVQRVPTPKRSRSSSYPSLSPSGTTSSQSMFVRCAGSTLYSMGMCAAALACHVPSGFPMAREPPRRPHITRRARRSRNRFGGDGGDIGVGGYSATSSTVGVASGSILSAGAPRSSEACVCVRVCVSTVCVFVRMCVCEAEPIPLSRDMSSDQSQSGQDDSAQAQGSNPYTPVPHYVPLVPEPVKSPWQHPPPPTHTHTHTVTHTLSHTHTHCHTHVYVRACVRVR